jgi:hypothetical protein
LNVHRWAPFEVPIGFKSMPEYHPTIVPEQIIVCWVSMDRRSSRGPLFCRSEGTGNRCWPDRTNSRSGQLPIEQPLQDSLPQKNRRQGDHPLPPSVLSFNRICSLPVNPV